MKIYEDGVVRDMTKEESNEINEVAGEEYTELQIMGQKITDLELMVLEGIKNG